MNTNEVVEMIDAISEGKEYRKKWTGVTEDEKLKFSSDDESILLATTGVFEIDNPRTAREIVGAILAWANRKEGKTSINRAIEAMGYDPVATQQVAAYDTNEKANVQRRFEELHEELHNTPDIPENKDKLISLQQEIQMLRERGAVDFKKEDH